jgi:predicted PurR-regulated permease PerM
LASSDGDSGLPPLSRAQRILLPFADAFMVAMLSRPPSGSLRTTRVTSVSIVLATAGLIVCGALGVVLALGAGSQFLPWLAAVLLEVFALNSGALALFGLLQRRPPPG